MSEGFNSLRELAVRVTTMNGMAEATDKEVQTAIIERENESLLSKIRNGIVR